MELRVKKLDENAIIPTKAHDGDLGYDLYALEDTLVWHGVTKVNTGIACEFPEGFGAMIRDRSSMATKAKIFVVAGIIDFAYRGPIIVAFMNPFFNTSDGPYTIKKGDKIAQMLLTRVHNFAIEEVTELSDTTRADGGFGSSGR